MSEKRPWTPGKWLYYDDGVGGCRNIIHADIGDFGIAITDGIYDDDQDRFNALLISKAPEMAEILIRLVSPDMIANLYKIVEDAEQLLKEVCYSENLAED